MSSNTEMREQYCVSNCLIDTLPSMIWIANTEKECTHFNKRWLDFVGDTLDSQLLNGWAEYVYIDDRKRCMDIFIDSFDKRLSFTMEYRLKYNDGSYRWILDMGNPLYQNHKFCGYVGACFDIDDKVKYRKLLSDNEQLYRKLFDSMSDPAILVDLDTLRIMDVNPSVVKKYGYGRFELLTMNIYELSSQPELSKNYISNKETFVPLRYHKNKDGFIFPVEISSSYFKVNNKEFSVSVIRDTIDRTK